jgi:hypothetical protein
MLFKEIIDIYSENLTKPTINSVGIKAGDTYSYHWASKG